MRILTEGQTYVAYNRMSMPAIRHDGRDSIAQGAMSGAGCNLAGGHALQFGSSTELVIKRGKSVPAEGKGVTLLARNAPLEHRCNECALPAVAICIECSLEEDSLL